MTDGLNLVSNPWERAIDSKLSSMYIFLAQRRRWGSAAMVALWLGYTYISLR